MLSAPGRKFHAPTADRAVLADPPAADLPRLARANAAALDASAVRVDGTPLGAFRRLAQAEVIAAAGRYLANKGEPVPVVPAGGVVATGHQPELFHPGVWVKNFALNRLARELGAAPLHLIVDNDTLKSAALKFPAWDGPTPRGVRLEVLAFDAFRGEEPYETRAVRDPDLFDSFADRAGGVTANWGFAPMLSAAWAEVVARPAGEPLGERFAAVRRARERAWGCHNLELPVSRLSATTAFRHFACQLLVDLPRFRDSYNRAIRDTRAANRIKSRNHPAPELAERGGEIEAPFWRATPTGRAKPFHAPGSPPDFADLRPRALTLTLFARVCFADLFVHGIGGGKYDEVTDRIIADYFGLEPPAVQVLSATVHLPVAGRPAAGDDPRTLRRTLRDAHWNPHRHLSAAAGDKPEVAELLARRAGLLALRPGATPDRRRWFRDLRAVTEQLRPFADTAGAAARLADAEARTADAAVLSRRDLAWPLYPEETLAGVMRGFL